ALRRSGAQPRQWQRRRDRRRRSQFRGESRESAVRAPPRQRPGPGVPPGGGREGRGQRPGGAGRRHRSRESRRGFHVPARLCAPAFERKRMIKFKDRIKRLRRGADYENYYTALDIGTEYIKALVVKREGRNGVVLGASRQRQEITDMQGGVPSNIQGIIDSCDRAMSQAEDMCDTIPGQAVIGIAGEQV